MDKPKFGAFRAAEMPKPKGLLCGAVGFLGRTCTRPNGHEGDHCNERQCGDQIITKRWDKESTMKIWLIKLERNDKEFLNTKETVYVAGYTIQGAVEAYLKIRLFYGEPIYKLSHLQSAVLLPFALAGVEGEKA